MEHETYVELKEQLQRDFDGRYVQITQCASTIKEEDAKIDEMMLEFTKSNTKLNILIGILSTIAVPILAICINLLFGG